MNPYDIDLLHLINGLAARNHGLGMAVAAFTKYAPVILLLLLVLMFVPRGRSADARRRGVIVAGIAGVAGVLVSVLLAMVIYRARPFAALPPGSVALLVPHGLDSSFPSDHVMGSAAIAAAVWMVGSSLARPVFALMALLVALSRVAVGAHWPSDVLASLIIGWLVGVGVSRALRPLHPLIDRLVDLYDRIDSRLAPGRR